MSVSIPISSSDKRPSRSNSISSSIVTIKKSASVSSRTGPRASLLRNRSTSPDSISRVLHSLNSNRSDTRGRTDTLEGRKANNNGRSVHRWSHSTSSSLSAIDADLIRKRTSSIRKSTGYTPNSIPPASQGRTSQDYKLDNKSSPKRSSSTSNRTSPLPGSRLAFQDSSNLNVVQDFSRPSYSGGPSAPSNSTWEQSSGVNKFGEPVQSLSIHYMTTAQSGQSANPSNSATPTVARIEDKAKSSHRRRSREPSKTRNRDATNQLVSNATDQAPRKEHSNTVEHKSPKRRDMLSRALAKANEAVLLDNAQNVNAAIEAYNEACELLQQVMVRSVDLADRRKLSSIKATYSRRIAELHDFDNTFVDLMRPLPDEPLGDDYENLEEFYQEDPTYAINDSAAIQLPLRQESLLPEIFGGDNYIHDRTLPPVKNPLPSAALNIPMDEKFMPQPLSPRPLIPSQPEAQDNNTKGNQTDFRVLPVANPSDNSASGTWLDQSDELSEGPESRLSSLEYERKEGQLLSAIEAEFDAMNAAVDAAYDDDLDQETTPRNANKNMNSTNGNRYNHFTGTYLDDEEEEEERMLDEMIEDYESHENRFGHQKTSALPRQSDSSGFSARTWGSSVASTTATTRTTLSTLAEIIEPPLHAPPTTALPEPPQSPPKANDSERVVPAPMQLTSDKPVGIRDRRMSGQSAKQLKIETFVKRGSIAQQTKAPGDDSHEVPKDLPGRSLAPAASFSSSLSSVQPSTPMLSVHSGEMPMYESPATPALTHGASTDDGALADASPSRHGRMRPPPTGPITRKHIPISSLTKGSLSINTGLLDPDPPMTPGSAMFGNDPKRPSSANTSSAISNPGAVVLTSMGLGGMYLFENYIGDPRNPRSPSDVTNEPAPLEPCPESFLLRPFWLMRCLYQALSHPRGGYISTKLFIPRDIWRVRNLKLKALEDKIAQCDLLTAALQKLAKVDTLDASAVLEELQSFESILEQVRSALSKKLGNDVGVSGSSSVFRASPAVDEPSELPSSKVGNTSSAAKSLAFSWRKLRSKSSTTNLNTQTRSDPSTQIPTMATVPMTSSSSVATSRSHTNARNRHPPPTPSALPQLLAPHAYYVSSLARLFDAVQILDGIARQVEDPGLKCSSQTHVGLELSVRNAAEFFAFYIIRFVMSDILTLLDKFVKRGGEWVVDKYLKRSNE